jgi:adenine phosphoribosyltransferase
VLVSELKKSIRTIPDFPKPGILFYDVTTLFRSADTFRVAVDRFVERYRDEPIDALAAIEARGFVLAAALAHRLGLGLVLVRKQGRLPAAIENESYELEYGQAVVEVHRDAVRAGQRILIVDDLLATGGTAAAAARLVRKLGGSVAGFAFLVELTFLGGRQRLDGDVFTLLRYDRDE